HEVDVAVELGDVGEDDHAVVRDLDEAAVHRELLLAVGQDQPHRPRLERGEERCMPGEERDVAATDRAAHDHVGVTFEQHPLGRHELDVQRHDSRSALAFSSTDSTPPTLKKACSGTSSSSPRHSASKLSTVSSMGTKMPFMPVNFSPTKNGWLRKRC